MGVWAPPGRLVAPKRVLDGSGGGFWVALGRFLARLGGLLRARWVAVGASGRPRSLPRRPKNGPRWPQDAPRRLPRGPKRPPRGLQRPPGPLKSLFFIGKISIFRLYADKAAEGSPRPLQGLLGASWEALGGLLEPLGASWGLLGGTLGAQRPPRRPKASPGGPGTAPKPPKSSPQSSPGRAWEPKATQEAPRPPK